MKPTRRLRIILCIAFICSTDCAFAQSPVIIAYTTNQTASPGGTVTLSVQATGSQPLAYHWYFNPSIPWFGANLPWATNSSLVINNASLTNVGYYAVSVTNSSGSAYAIESLFVMQVEIFIGLGIAAPTNISYRVEYTTNLTAPIIWTPFTNYFSITNYPFELIDRDSAKSPRRFYRIIASPPPPIF